MEIERKFLVRGDFPRERGVRIVQGYLCSDPERTVRVRIADTRAFLTIKGLGEGACRPEWEYEIPLSDAEELMVLAESTIEKHRWFVDAGDGHTFEVDEFHGENEGLIIAELEQEDADEPFARPPWLGDEVTGDSRYFNSQLARRR